MWSNDATRYYGNITARGGAQGGDGGFVEVSGKQNLAFAGTFDARAPKGKAGSLLLDPTKITICDATIGGCALDIISPDGGTTWNISGGGSMMDWQTLDSNLTGGTVTV